MPKIEKYLDSIKDLPEAEVDKAQLDNITHVLLNEVVFELLTKEYKYKWGFEPEGNLLFSTYLQVLQWAVNHGRMTEEEKTAMIRIVIEVAK